MKYKYLESAYIEEKNIVVEGIPLIVFKLKGNKEKLATIFFYHGWSSRKEYQRLRGFVLASIGFQVIIPDLIYHGERSALLSYNLESSQDFFWETVLQSIEEFNILKEFALNNLSADENRLGVAGNSMGGFISIGILNRYRDIASAVCFNGSGSWIESNRIFRYNGQYAFETENLKDIEVISECDPIKNLKNLKERPLLLLHGLDDHVVPVVSQQNYYDAAKLYYQDANKIKLITYKALDHYVTSNMLEEMAIWFKTYL